MKKKGETQGPPYSDKGHCARGVQPILRLLLYLCEGMVFSVAIKTGALRIGFQRPDHQTEHMGER